MTPAAIRTLSFAELARRSTQVANFLAGHGLRAGDRVLLMLPNVVPLWETMLAAIRLGAVMIPATTLLERDRPRRSSRARPGPGHRHRGGLTGASAGACRRTAANRGRGGGVRAGSTTTTSRRAPRRCRGRDARRRAHAAVLHLRHHGTPEARRAHATSATRSGISSTMYWLGLRPRRRTSEPELAGLGEARLVELLRSLECRRRPSSPITTSASMRVRCSSQLVRCRVTHLLRAADRVAHADPARPARLARAAARGGQRRRAAQSRGHRAGARGLGPHDPRWFRPDRDHGADRQSARTAAEARLDGPSATGLPGDADRRARPAGAGGRDLHRARAAARRRSCRAISTIRSATPKPWRDGYYHTGDVAQPRRRRLSHLRRPHGRRVQVVRLPHQPVRARERADRAPVRSSRRRWSRARTRCGWRYRRRSWCWSPGRRAGCRRPRAPSCSTCASASRRTSASGGSSSPPCRRPSPAKSAASNCASWRRRRGADGTRRPHEFWEEDVRVAAR